MPEIPLQSGPVLVSPAPTPANYFARALGYWIVAALVLLGGFLINPLEHSLQEWWLLVVPLSSSGTLAFAYAICFHRDGDETVDDVAWRVPHEKAWIVAVTVIAAALATICLLVFYIWSGSLPTAALLMGMSQ
jgi:hypothetical protein